MMMSLGRYDDVMVMSRYTPIFTTGFEVFITRRRESVPHGQKQLTR